MKLIDELLNGAEVEWKPLEEVADIGTGRSNRQDEVENGKYPFYVRSKTILRSNDYQFDENAIIVPGEGGIGDIFHYIQGKYALHQRAYRIRVNINWINTKFLYHYMKYAFKHYIMSKSVGATVTSIRKPMLEQFPIPIPCPNNLTKSLEIQHKIVDILDKFTTLEAELEAELDCRKRQYEYYRNQLLSFDILNGKGKLNNVTIKTLGEVFETRNGYTPSKANKEFWQGGTIPWFRMEDIRINGRILNDAIQHITAKAIKGKGLFEAGSIIMATTATIGEHALLIADSLANQQFTNFKIRKLLSDRLLPKFSYYYFFIIDEWCRQNVNVSSFPSVDMDKLKKQPFPIPPLSEQQRIVDILDKFDTLITSISEGLPKEIELRRKQYEYYRNALLSFPKHNLTA